MPSLLKAKGLNTYHNELNLREGALIRAKNVVIDKDDVVTPRRGFAEYGDNFPATDDRSKQMMIYKDRIIRHYDNTLQFDDGSGTFADFSGTYSELETGLRIKYIESNGNLYFTTTDGIKKISATAASEFTTAADYITNAGAPKALNIEGINNANISGFLTEESKTAYRALWGYKDSNTNLLLGSPSERLISINSGVSIGTITPMVSGLDDMSTSGQFTGTVDTTYEIEIDAEDTPDTFQWTDDNWSTTITGVAITGAAQLLNNGVYITFDATTGHTDEDGWEFDAENVNKDVTLTMPIPNDVTSTSYFYQVYRTAVSSTSIGVTLDDIDPGEEMNLVYELAVTDADISAGEVSFTDNTPDSFREGGVLLYTNPISGDGIGQANEKPPVAQDMALFKESLFFGNTSTIQRRQFNILSTNNFTKTDPSFVGSGLDDMIVGGVYDLETTTTYKIEIDGTPLSYAIALANSLKTKYNSHIGDGSDHTAGTDGANNIVALDATNLATLITLVSEFLVDYPAHDDDVDNGTPSYHVATSSLNNLASISAPTTLNECITRLDDFKAKFNLHDADTTSHGVGSQYQESLSTILVDSFRWSDDGGSTWDDSEVPITGSAQTLNNGITITFNDTTGHTDTEYWTFDGRETYLNISNSTGVTKYMFTDTTDIGNRKVAVSTSSSVSTSIDETARELVKVINRDTTGLVYAYYLSGADDLPGIILLENRSLGDPSFYLGVEEPIGEEFSPTIPEQKVVTAASQADPTQISVGTHGWSTGDVIYVQVTDSTPVINDAYTITKIDAGNFTIPVEVTVAGTAGIAYKTTMASDNEVAPNRLYFSKTSQPEAVPLLNYVDIGPKDSEIKRIIALRDNLFVMKEDGVYIVSGSSAPNFSVTVLDPSANITAPDSVTVLNNEIFGLFTQGVATVSDTGVGVISRGIENLISDATNSRVTNFKTASFGVSYDSDRAYQLWLPTKNNDTYATQCYRYNIFNRTWVRWELAATCAVVNPTDDKLYIGDAENDFIRQERKNGDRTDFSDLIYTVNSIVNGVNGATISMTSLNNIEFGDVLFQEQWVTISRFNRMLKKLDFDPGLDDTDYHSTLAIDTGANDFTALEALRVKIDADDSGQTYPTTSPSDFEDLMTEWNMITGKLNEAASDAVYNDYQTISTSVEYEFIIVSKDAKLRTLTGQNEVPFFQGEFVLYKHIEAFIEWAPQDFGDPSVMKQVHEGSIVFDGNQFYSAEMAFASDLSQAFEGVEFKGQGSGTFGMTEWGETVWGGEGDDKPFRTLVPRQKQRCRYISVGFRHSNARESFAILGITLTMRPLSTRGYRNAEGGHTS